MASAGVLAAASMLPRVRWAGPARGATGDGTSPVSMAMHIHSSFSEQDGSMAAHLREAQRGAVDVVWWTDHDWRMSAFGLRNVVHFTSLANETGDGKPWTWKQERVGSLTTASTGGIVSSPASPLDGPGSLRVRAQSAVAGRSATLRFYADAHASDWSYRTSLAGQTLYLEVRPEEADTNGYLELLVTMSFQPARGGRPAGSYSISYRFGGPGAPGERVAKGLRGIVTVGAAAGQWNSIAIRPAEDIRALWPDLDGRDFGLFALRLGAVSSGAPTSGNFDYLRFSRATSGDLPLQVQQAIGVGLATLYPEVTQRQGLEVSYISPHVNWFGGGITLPDYSGARSRSDVTFLRSLIADIHRRGGVVSYNHPFGMDGGAPQPVAMQDRRQSQIAANLLGNRAHGADLIEVGYAVRGQADAAHHVAVWDVCSRNALFLTGTGTSDDHVGRDWQGRTNDWTSSVWAASKAEADLLGALRAGRAWSGSLTGFRGTLDLSADGSCPMGSASVSSLDQRQLLVSASGLPGGGSLQVIQGAVDYAGTAAPAPNNTVVASYSDIELAAGSLLQPVDTTRSSYVRAQVRDATGTVVGLSNPIWLLRGTPPKGIPPARMC